MLIARDLANQMKVVHATEKQWEIHASLVLRYTLDGLGILLWLLPVGQGCSLSGPLIVSTNTTIP